MLTFISLYGQKFLEKMGWVSAQSTPHPTGCRAITARLKRTLPTGQKTYCKGNNLAVEIPYSTENKTLKDEILCPLLYRETANSLKSIAASDLEQIDRIHLKLIHPRLTITAITEGDSLAKSSTITDPQFLADHFKATVRIQETPSTRCVLPFPKK